jgi:uncharacterized protein HemX
MFDDSIQKRLDALIDKLTTRNQTVQEKKQSGPGGWIVAVVLALISLVGIGIAMYLAHRQAKELAKAKTKIEQDKVAQEQKAHEIKKETHLVKRNALLAELKKKEVEIQDSERVLKEAKAAHAERAKKIKNLNAWSEINES